MAMACCSMSALSSGRPRRSQKLAGVRPSTAAARNQAAGPGAHREASRRDSAGAAGNSAARCIGVRPPGPRTSAWRQNRPS